MIFAHTGDLHITEQKDESGVSLDEQVELLEWIGVDAEENGADALLVGGDVFDATSTPNERNAALRVVASWAQRMPVAIVRGNHDRPGDLLYLARLRTAFPVQVVESPTVLDIGGGGRIACLPWPRKSALAAALGTTSAVDLNAVATQAMRAVLDGFRLQLDAAPGLRLLLGHVELGAALTDSGQPLAGRCDIELGEGDLLDVGADAVLLSHIHRHQIIRERIVYAGSPRPTTFGESGAKGYCLVEPSRAAPPVVTHRRAPYRELVTVDADWVGDRLVVAGTHEMPLRPDRALVRLRYHCPETARAQAAAQAEAIAAQMTAASVRIVPEIETVSRVRSETIAVARTTTDKLIAYWESREQVPDRSDAILSKLNQIEAEVA
jgi:exonuclease SbcD